MQEIKRQFFKLSVSFQSVFVVLIASLFVVTVLYAATTIGSNISTGGTLTVTSGLTTLSDLRSTNLNASTTANFNYINSYLGATTTRTLYVGSYASSTGGLNTQGAIHAGGALSIDGAATLNGNVTSTGAFGIVVGSESATVTTTLKIKSSSAAGSPTVGHSCIEMVSVEGAIYRVYITGAGALRAEAGACK